MHNSTTPTAAPAGRLPAIDALRGLAALGIVLHHFSLYGPLAGLLHRDIPAAATLAADYGRFAVYVFLVVAGFMAARILAECSTRAVVPIASLLLRRYLRLVLPLAVALLLAVFCAALARHWTDHDYLPAAVTPAQFLAHLTLLQSLLGFESLTTGVWYLAIEMQLFASALLLVYLPTGLPRYGLRAGPIALLSLASWAWWHPDPNLEDWALHFFGAYGLGILAAHAALARLQGQRLFCALFFAANLVLLISDWRGRMAVALLTAILLLRVGLRAGKGRHFESSVHWFGERSYALFLVHFPVLMLLNTAIEVWPQMMLFPGALLLAVGVIFSVTLAALFHAVVERPAVALLDHGKGVPRMAELPRVV